MYTLYNNDCMKYNGDVHARLMLTDIPYTVINRESNGIRSFDKGNADTKTFDLLEWLEKWYEHYDICVIFCGNEQYSTIYDFFASKHKNDGTTRQIVWCKSNPSPVNCQYVYMSATENAVMFKKKGTGLLNNKYQKNYLEFPIGSSKIHPTEKNHKLLESLILNLTKDGDIILDPCTGSGSTGLVALKNNRRFYGIELDKEWYEIAKSRLEDFMKNYD